MYARVTKPYFIVSRLLEASAPYLGLLFVRLLLAWEFGESGYAKLTGQNWFAELTFPFPFNLLPPDISWYVAMIFEMAGAIALLLGFATRFFSLSLIVLTIVAIASVHWPEHWSSVWELLQGYRIEDIEGDGFGNYKLPLIYLVMLLPLVFFGAGKISLDYLIYKKFNYNK
jgi:putative oxidoreductase